MASWAAINEVSGPAGAILLIRGGRTLKPVIISSCPIGRDIYIGLSGPTLLSASKKYDAARYAAKILYGDWASAPSLAPGT